MATGRCICGEPSSSLIDETCVRCGESMSSGSIVTSSACNFERYNGKCLLTGPRCFRRLVFGWRLWQWRILDLLTNSGWFFLWLPSPISVDWSPTLWSGFLCAPEKDDEKSYDGYDCDGAAHGDPNNQSDAGVVLCRGGCRWRTRACRGA